MSKTNKPSYKNKAVFAVKISNLIEHGRIEITTKKELDKYSIGSLISYINIRDEFKQGGFVIKITKEYFIYLAPDFETKYRIKFENIKKMWVGDVYKVKNDLVSLVKTKQNKTNFPIKIGDIIVYYASDNFDVKRFKNTKKYVTMCKWYEMFGKK
ncbi:hypothetical protein [Bandra megavirus]|uniref:Uncharacterized protein n=1 Tax=Bandra megavirus TaxID=2071566 RepID=A0A2K9V710_9VIRU|nr:hypothetical protein [Bandra megavirus]